MFPLGHYTLKNLMNENGNYILDGNVMLFASCVESAFHSEQQEKLRFPVENVLSIAIKYKILKKKPNSFLIYQRENMPKWTGK